MFKRGIGLIALSFLFWTPISLLAQTTNGTPYFWDTAGLTFNYPTDWDEPIPVNEDGQTVLRMAQTLADSPDIRPPGVPIINLELLIGDDIISDFTPLVEQGLTQLGTPLAATNPITMLELDGLEAIGTSEDSQFFGIVRAVQLPDSQVLIISGRAPAAQQDLFLEHFNGVTNSLSLGTAVEETLIPSTTEYGVVWNTTRTAADGETAFIDLKELAYNEGILYTLDALMGVVMLDAQSGAVLATYPNENLIAPSDIAVTADGTVYAGDTVCQCIFSLSNGEWGSTIEGFGLGAPFSLTAGGDGTLYATDQTDTELRIRVFQNGAERSISLSSEIISQPILTADAAGHILGLTPDGQVWILQNDAFNLYQTLGISDLLVNDFAAGENGQFMLATSTQGILVTDAEGLVVNQVGRIVANYPLPGEIVNPRGVVSTTDGTLYIADSDGTFGAITAMSTQVMQGRVGDTLLIPGVVVQGTLNPQILKQEWTLNGSTGQRVTISAVDLSGIGALDLSLKLIAPDGSEEAVNDDHLSGDLPGLLDAQITNQVLAASGTYTVQVERVEGEGNYHLAVTTDQPFELSAEGVTQLSGSLADALPVQRWVFQGSAGQVFTITMQAKGAGTLDPIISVYSADGTLLEENDDAADTALGRNAQIVGLQLPSDGLYYLDARRFEGEGTYSIVIVTTS